jgi:hypothetical protein
VKSAARDRSGAEMTSSFDCRRLSTCRLFSISSWTADMSAFLAVINNFPLSYDGEHAKLAARGRSSRFTDSDCFWNFSPSVSVQKLFKCFDLA